MKSRIKSKPKSKHSPMHRPAAKRRSRVVAPAAVGKVDEDNVFTPMETGRPDTDPVPDVDNPTGAAGGLGPTNQEGEGERQNDQLAALEETDPDD
jgi:hypothetical protein